MGTLRQRAYLGRGDRQRERVERNVGVVDGLRELTTRAALTFYILRRLNLDLEGSAPVRAQVRPANCEEVERARRQARRA